MPEPAAVPAETPTPRPLAEAVAPLLVPGAEAARMCGVSRATWCRLNAAGKVPRAVRLSGSVRWRRDDLAAWVALGCPDRATFEAP